MNREIKFRGLHKNAEHIAEWKYGEMRVYHLQNPKGYLISDENDRGWYVNPDTIGQYTGMKDKKGVEIYEGDMLFDGSFYSLDHGLPVVSIGSFTGEWLRYIIEEDEPEEIELNGVYMTTKHGHAIGLNQDIVSRFEVLGNIHERGE